MKISGFLPWIFRKSSQLIFMPPGVSQYDHPRPFNVYSDWTFPSFPQRNDGVAKYSWANETFQLQPWFRSTPFNFCLVFDVATQFLHLNHKSRYKTYDLHSFNLKMLISLAECPETMRNGWCAYYHIWYIFVRLFTVETVRIICAILETENVSSTKHTGNGLEKTLKFSSLVEFSWFLLHVNYHPEARGQKQI